MHSSSTAENRLLLHQKRDRWLRAVRLERQDRVPVVLSADAYAARQAGLTLAEYVEDWNLALRVTVEALTKWGEIDGVAMSFFPPAFHPYSLLMAVKLPGRDLPNDVMWQLDEQCLVGTEIYDQVVELGWDAWFEQFVAREFPGLDEVGERLMAFLPEVHAAWEAAGVPCLHVDGGGEIPLDPLCGARSMKEFMLDLHRVPDKVQAAIDVAMPSVLRWIPESFPSEEAIGFPVYAARGSSDLLSPRLWERFVFPYLLPIVEATVKAGGVPVFHFDGDWNRVVPRLLDFPAKSCVVEFDGRTDIFKAKEVLGDHMCIKGDVPASLLTLGTPAKVGEYCRRLIAEVGPEGFILSQACCIPCEAKAENVRAMIESIHA